MAAVRLGDEASEVQAEADIVPGATSTELDRAEAPEEEGGLRGRQPGAAVAHGAGEGRGVRRRADTDRVAVGGIAQGVHHEVRERAAHQVGVEIDGEVVHGIGREGEPLRGCHRGKLPNDRLDEGAHRGPHPHRRQHPGLEPPHLQQIIDQCLDAVGGGGRSVDGLLHVGRERFELEELEIREESRQRIPQVVHEDRCELVLLGVSLEERTPERLTFHPKRPRPQEPPHPELQLAEVNRFGEEVIDSGLESRESLRPVDEGGHEEDGEDGLGMQGSDPSRDGQAIEVRQHHIEQDEVHRFRRGESQRLLPGRRLEDVTGGGEEAPEHQPGRRGVVDDQEGRRSRGGRGGGGHRIPCSIARPARRGNVTGMKGMVFTHFLDFVTEKFGPEMADDIIEANELPSGGAYTSVGTYSHTEMVAMVGTLAERTGVPADALVRAFGDRLSDTFAHDFPDFYRRATNLFDFLESIEAHIHIEVRKLYPDAELPTFRTESRTLSRLVLRYSSPRRMGHLSEGLISGSARQFGVEVRVRAETLADTDGLDVRFTIDLA